MNTEEQTNEEINLNEIVSEEIKEEVKSETPDLNIWIEKEKYLRLLAEFENYKKRTQKEKEDFLKTSNLKIVLDILPTLDNFERAGKLEDGIKLIYDNLKKTLEKYNVKEVEVKGFDFNPDIMEAITQIPNEEMKGKVVDVIEKGYEMNGKIIRLPKVVVGC